MIKNNKSFNTCFRAGGVLFCVFTAFLFTVFGTQFAQAQTAMVTEVSANYPTTGPTNYQCEDDSTLTDVSLLKGQGNFTDTNLNSDPWHNSALIEFDQPYPDSSSANNYPNHCLRLCAEVTCVNPSRKTTGASGSSSSVEVPYEVGSSDFPIQSVLFEVFKYQPGSNPYNADTTPPIRTIALTPTDNNTCAGVGVYYTNQSDPATAKSCCDKCFHKPMENVTELCGTYTTQTECKAPKISGSIYVNNNAIPLCEVTTGQSWQTVTDCQICQWDATTGKCVENTYWPAYNACQTPSQTTNFDYDKFYNMGICKGLYNAAVAYPECDSCSHFRNRDECRAGISKLSFCASWDGSYEIDGEFGKSNGQFGFRAHIQTKWPGDGISSGGDVEVNHTMAYPGVVGSGRALPTVSQIPIQVDVTNVHSVRSSSTMVGTTTKVPAQPYDLIYKLSKDATTTIRIMDAPGLTCPCRTDSSRPHVPDIESYANYYALQCGLTPGDTTLPSITSDLIDFDLISGQPRLGEGIPNGTNTNLDSWDGRDDKGIFLPHGNYLASIQAVTRDEWTKLATEPSDISRAVTRQLSLDPLKITDIKETGLAKLSTSYAKIDYVLTESATVHVMIFTPGTYFTSVDMPTYLDPNLIEPANNSGNLVAHIAEQKQGRVNVNTKWDGVCRNSQGCHFNSGTYNEGTPMPDGDYVYVMWAEIPYSLTTDTTRQNVVCVNGQWWAGVRTYKYHNGILPINRGLPEITVGAVGYTSLGSSPTAFGLDPFTFNYAVSRDAIVDATIKTTANQGETPQTVKTLLTNEVAVSAKENRFTWDGIDDDGYQVAPGTYMVEFIAKDSLYPEKQATMTVQFPVDLFRVVDVNTTSLLDEATAQATINYTLSKSMDVTVEIYDQDVTIPTDDTSWCQYDSSGTLIHVGSYTPLKTFILPKAGEGMTITEVWDGLKESVPGTSAVEPLPDGNYPYRICTRTTQDIASYYDLSSGVPVAQAATYDRGRASDKPTGFITIARGSIAFNKVLISASQPELKYSTETIYLPAYEVAFSTSRSASVEIQVISTDDGQCEGGASAGTVCRTLSAYTYGGTDGYFDPTKIYKVYWDGKDSKGQYVKYGSYEVKLTGLPYPLPAGPQPLETIFSQVISVNNFQVYDRYVEDITRENPNGKFAYQISVPMKVAIQILKPGTTTNRNATTATGLYDPNTNADVATTNINDVLVKSIVGIRPNLVSLDEIWDGTDYAGQEVPDGIYPYRYVTVLDAYNMDSVTGAINVGATDTLANAGTMVADWEKYITLEHINVARGDSWYADLDWKSSKVTSFFPNPLSKPKGWFEITKLPAPGRVTIKIYNIAGDLVKDKGYDCINAKGETDTLENINAKGGLQPYMTLQPPVSPTAVSRNFTLRCEWNKTNNHGKKVARGLYYAIMELDPTRGNAKKSQRVIKILIP